MNLIDWIERNMDSLLDEKNSGPWGTGNGMGPISSSPNWRTGLNSQYISGEYLIPYDGFDMRSSEQTPEVLDQRKHIEISSEFLTEIYKTYIK